MADITSHVHSAEGMPHFHMVVQGDPANPDYYRSGFRYKPCECIHLTILLPFALGNAVKYIWRIGRKDAIEQERQKALWYIEGALGGKKSRIDRETAAAANAILELIEEPEEPADAAKLDIIRMIIKAARACTRRRLSERIKAAVDALAKQLKGEDNA